MKTAGDGLYGLRPRDSFPSPLSSFAFSSPGMKEPIRVGQPLRRSQSFWASIAPVQKPMRVPFDFNDTISSHPDKKTASPVIHSRAVGSFPLDFFGHSFSLSSERWGEAPRVSILNRDRIARPGGHSKAWPGRNFRTSQKEEGAVRRAVSAGDLAWGERLRKEKPLLRTSSIGTTGRGVAGHTVQKTSAGPHR